MSFLLFLRGMIIVLVVFAVTSYVVTQSFWSAFIQTLICAVLLQVGYFAAVLFLVWRSGGKTAGNAAVPESEASQASTSKEQPAAKVSHLRGAPPSR